VSVSPLHTFFINAKCIKTENPRTVVQRFSD
jgi:hypothetical protein